MFATEKQFRLSAHPSCCNHNIVKAQDFQHDRNPDSDSLCFPAAPAQMQECFLSSPQSPQLSNWGSPALTWKSCQHILISINSRLLNPNHHTECQNETWKHPEKMKKWQRCPPSSSQHFASFPARSHFVCTSLMVEASRTHPQWRAAHGQALTAVKIPVEVTALGKSKGSTCPQDLQAWPPHSTGWAR